MLGEVDLPLPGSVADARTRRKAEKSIIRRPAPNSRGPRPREGPRRGHEACGATHLPGRETRGCRSLRGSGSGGKAREDRCGERSEVVPDCSIAATTSSLSRRSRPSSRCPRRIRLERSSIATRSGRARRWLPATAVNMFCRHASAACGCCHRGCGCAGADGRGRAGDVAAAGGGIAGRTLAACPSRKM